jgi:hypothetical protein
VTMRCRHRETLLSGCRRGRYSSIGTAPSGRSAGRVCDRTIQTLDHSMPTLDWTGIVHRPRLGRTQGDNDGRTQGDNDCCMASTAGALLPWPSRGSPHPPDRIGRYEGPL